MASLDALVESTTAPAAIESVPTPSSPVPSALTFCRQRDCARAGQNARAGIDRQIAGRREVHVAVGQGRVNSLNLNVRGACRNAAQAALEIGNRTKCKPIAGQSGHEQTDGAAEAMSIVA